MNKTKTAERQEAVTELKQLLSKGDTVYTVLRHVSRSGMSRVMDLYIMRDNQPRRITWSAAKALDWGYSTRPGNEGLKVGGCGMDMGFHAVYTLASVLWREESAKGCGYLLSHRWI